MTRRHGTTMLVALIVAVGLTLGSAARLDVLEHPILGASGPDARPFPAPDPALDPTPDPTSRTEQSRTSGPGPAGPHERLRSAPAPVLLNIEALGVRAAIARVGVQPDGGMEIPDDIRTVGWYATEHRRVSPGDPGVAVIAGHRDSRSQGRGALHDLADLAQDTTIHIVHADGQVTFWRVTDVLSTPREELPGDLLFSREGAPRLAVVTCGGRFDTRTRSYSHNTIVLAHLVATEDRSG
jgi:hypothetical protein